MQIWLLRLAAAGIIYGLAAWRLPSVSERVYVAIPLLFAFEAVVMWLRGDRAGRRRRLTVVAVLAGGVGVAAVLDRWGFASGFQPGELPICLYALFAVVLVARWIWIGLFVVMSRVSGVRSDSGTARRLINRVATLVVFVFVLDAYLLAIMEVHWPKRRNPHTPKQLRLDYEEVAWASIDGTGIRGWWVPAEGSGRTAVVCHGVGAFKADMLEFMYVLHEGGYNVLALDFRGHGDSDGHTVTYGRLEQWDIIKGVDWVRGRHPAACRRIVGVGWSMGAASLILAAAEDARIEALHVDAAYARTFDIARVITQTQPAVFRPAGLYLGTALGSLESGTNLFTLAPVAVVDAISPRPVMFVHGTMDTIIPIEQGRQLFAAAREPKFWHEIAGAGHCQTQAIDTPVYDERMLAFLDAALAGERD